MTDVMPAASTRVGAVTDLTPGEGRTYVVDGTEIAVFLLTDGTVRAVQSRCPHRGGPLADGQVGGRTVMCPLHQFQFSLDDGVCHTGDQPTLLRFAATVRDGDIYLTSSA